MKLLAPAPAAPAATALRPSREAAKPRRPASLLLAISPLDAREFLPDALGAEVRGFAADYHEFNPLVGSPEGFARLLAQLDPEIVVTGWKTPPLPENLPPSLRYVCHLTGTVRELVRRRHLEDGLLVTNWGGSIARVVAEGALFHVLASLRRATHWALAMHRDGAWKTREAETASLFGRRIGIHGFGRVARELVALLAPFGARVSVCAPDVDAAAERAYGIRKVDTLEGLFADNDVVIELAPLNPETEGIVTERLLRLLRPGSVFVNTGRGRVVEEAGLVNVAREGKVFFGLDVFAVEPLAADHPLRGLPNVTLTPHLGGPTTDRRRDAGAHGVRNLRAYAAGEPLEAVVTPELYDISS
ncbi:MAG: hydroxyacid dehydrogenase [Opitutaceae bacterium]|jgi:phosphoglycerate dehydrogenase-like enzyme|nr:hydroxyacid dehydrogenase [Opitutaceae bacterium]